MPAQSSKPKLGITRGLVETILHWFREISSKFFLQQKPPASVPATERHTESVAEQAGSIATATEKTAKSFAELATADLKVSSDAQISPVAHIVPDQQEIQRRRDLVRALFNDFWSGSDDKPAGFADRLNQAENYINERLAACGEFWQLDAKTRAMLSLPPGSNLPNKGKTA
ncbi:MAG: hypothetical protein WA728_12575 [Xanthobacteraceae bacterium]